MGEIDETKQGIPSEKEAPPSGKGEITPKETPQTYTQDQVDKTVNAALTKAGRDAKSFEQRENAIKAQEDANKAKQAERDAAELAEAQGDPDKMAVYQSKQTEKQRKTGLDAREAALTKSEAEHAEEIRIAKETQQEIAIREIATEHKVDPVKLKNLSTKFNIEGKEQLAELAEEIASGKPDPNINPDSGNTTGGKKDLSGMSPMELAREGYSKSK